MAFLLTPKIDYPEDKKLTEIVLMERRELVKNT
jgi:hypothetical protein